MTQNATRRRGGPPPGSLNSHQQRMKLGREVMGKRRIYLDQMWWVYCRAVETGIKQGGDDATWAVRERVWRALKALVESGRAVCPISYPVMAETFKQTDERSLKATALVVDQLSKGIALQPWPHLATVEAYWLLAGLGEDMKIKPIGAPVSERVWTHVGVMMGEPRLAVRHAGRIEAEVVRAEEALHEVAFEAATKTTFSDLVSALGPVDQEGEPEDQCDRLNEGAKAHEDEFSTFPEVFLHEVKGALDSMADSLAEAQRQLRWNLREPEDSLRWIVANGQLEALRFAIYAGYHSGGWSTEFPTIHIHGGIHAALRYRRQKYRKGDSYDFLHAVAALPYCDIFLTERTLGNLITSDLLRLDQAYGTKVLWKAEEIAQTLEGLVRDG